MNTPMMLKTLALASMLSFGSGAFAADRMSSADVKAAKERISAEHKADKAACDRLAGNAKDVCQDEADGKEKIAKAELEYQRTGKAKDAEKLADVKAEAAYEVAKERCDDRSGNDKDVCVKEAKAAETRAKADAKAARKTGEARHDAMEDRRQAEYKVAAERCDAMSGAAKSQCVDAAKQRYGQN